MEYKLTTHARDMIKERQISENWVEDAMSNPDHTEEKEDGTTHYIKKIVEYGNRYLRVIVNPKGFLVVTVFFDRRLKGGNI